MPKNQIVLIVEDEALIAISLAEALEDLGLQIVGPVPSVAQALILLETHPVTAAVLDANLIDRDVTPVAVKLIEQSVPFVVHTGTGLPAELAAIQPTAPLVMKPGSIDRVVARLMQELAAREAQPETGPLQP